MIEIASTLSRSRCNICPEFYSSPWNVSEGTISFLFQEYSVSLFSKCRGFINYRCIKRRDRNIMWLNPALTSTIDIIGKTQLSKCRGILNMHRLCSWSWNSAKNNGACGPIVSSRENTWNPLIVQTSKCLQFLKHSENIVNLFYTENDNYGIIICSTANTSWRK